MLSDYIFPYYSARKYLKILENIESLNKKMLHLTANENVLSDLATRFYESSMGLRYDFGRGKDGVISVDFFGNFAAATYPEMHDIIDIAYSEAKRMLHAKGVNLHCLSGAHAMMCAMIGSSKPGDMIMSVREEDGGHFCTKKIVEAVGRKHIFTTYNLKSLTFNVQETVNTYYKSHAKVLYLDTSVFLKPHPLKELRSMLPKDAIIIYDASHTLGLIMGGVFQSPLEEGADIISANTHKTFPGPHKGMLAFRSEAIGNIVNGVIQNTLYSTFHTNNLLALAISIIEFGKYGKQYAQQIVKNSNALGAALEKRGFDVRHIEEMYSENHQVHMFFQQQANSLVRMFLQNNISVTTSDALGGRAFLRLGTQEITKRGMKEPEMNKIADFITDTMAGKFIPKEVDAFNASFSSIHYAFPYS